MKKFIVIIAVCSSCASNYAVHDTNFELVIEVPNSYKYDLKNNIFTIFYVDKSPEEVKFQLSKEEKNSLQEKYYEFRLNKLAENIDIEGTCMIMPLLYTNIIIKRDNNIIQKIKIDRGCTKFNIFNSGKAERVNNFINYVFKILNSKPEIKNSPKSNIKYL